MNKIILFFFLCFVSMKGLSQTYKANDKVQIEYEGSWYPGYIMEVKTGQYKIHYDGYGSDWDSWVPASRLKAPEAEVETKTAEPPVEPTKESAEEPATDHKKVVTQTQNNSQKDDTTKSAKKKASLADMFGGQKKFGLKNKKVKELQISVKENPGQSHTLGSSFAMIIKAVLEDGTELVTKGAGDGKTSWDNYAVEVNGGSFSGGILTIDYDYTQIKNHTIIMTATNAYDASVKKQYEIHLTYDGNVSRVFSGASGRNGAQGQNGASGYDGGRTSGARGGDGGNGGNGGDGESGENGPDVDVYIKAVKDALLNKDLLYIKIGNYISVVDPAVAKFSVESDGGNGGMGGGGGNGGSGGRGGGCSCASSKENGVINGGDGGNGGIGGNGGNGANVGNGGRVTIYVDPSAQKYSSVISAYSSGGSGGSAGFSGSAGNAGSGGSASTSNAGTDTNGVHYDYPGGKYGSSGKSGSSGTRGSRDGKNGMPGPQPKIIVQAVTF